jgi:hypothetical protein
MTREARLEVFEHIWYSDSSACDPAFTRLGQLSCYLAQDDMLSERPRNPVGRTGVKGRGMLGKWGPNFAADPLVTRFHPVTGQMQMVAIQRGDGGGMAIPGGMVEPGERAHRAAGREFIEEARAMQETSDSVNDCNVLDRTMRALDELLDGGVEIFRGYVHDPRNTDNAWIETTAYHFHIENGSVLQNMALKGGSDARSAFWLDVRGAQLYANHADILNAAVTRFMARRSGGDGELSWGGNLSE